MFKIYCLNCGSTKCKPSSSYFLLVMFLGISIAEFILWTI